MTQRVGSGRGGFMFVPKVLVVVLVLVLALLGACGPAFPQAPQNLVLAILPTATPETLAAESRELEAFLEARVGVDVEIRVPTLYAGAIEALRFGHAQAAFMSAWPAALARKHAGARLVELGLVDPAGKEIDPKQFFSEVYFAGGYAQAWEALKKGQVDATVIAGDVSEKLYREVPDGTPAP